MSIKDDDLALCSLTVRKKITVQFEITSFTIFVDNFLMVKEVQILIRAIQK